MQDPTPESASSQRLPPKESLHAGGIQLMAPEPRKHAMISTPHILAIDLGNYNEFLCHLDIVTAMTR